VDDHGVNANVASVTALLLYGNTHRHPALRHEVPLAIPDPFVL
jgi:hypothetical protein